jgi:hypothetical protein
MCYIISIESIILDKGEIFMAYNVKIGHDYELFGLTGDIKAEIIDAIRHHMGREFANFVEDEFINEYELSLEDIIAACDNYEDGDSIDDTLNEIKIIAQNGLSERCII